MRERLHDPMMQTVGHRNHQLALVVAMLISKWIDHIDVWFSEFSFLRRYILCHSLSVAKNNIIVVNISQPPCVWSQAAWSQAAAIWNDSALKIIIAISKKC